MTTEKKWFVSTSCDSQKGFSFSLIECRLKSHFSETKKNTNSCVNFFQSPFKKWVWENRKNDFFTVLWITNDHELMDPRAKFFSILIYRRNYWKFIIYRQALRSSFILSLFTKVYFIFFHFIIMKTYLFLEHFCVLPDARSPRLVNGMNNRNCTHTIITRWYLHKSSRRCAVESSFIYLTVIRQHTSASYEIQPGNDKRKRKIDRNPKSIC